MTNSKLSSREIQRYARQIALPTFGKESQEKLKMARVAVIGAGGLGSPVLQYLAASGVGNLSVFDFDVVELSNLQRQVLFKETDLGKKKAEAAKKRINRLNPEINVTAIDQAITAENVLELLSGFDVIVDGSDNFLTRYVVDDACCILGIPLVYGSVYQFEGQVSVFHLSPDENPISYRDIFPEMPAQNFIPNCVEAGVLGALPGIIGSIQALETIKIITGIGDVLHGKMLMIDTLSIDFTVINLPKFPTDRNHRISEAHKRLMVLSNKSPEHKNGYCEASAIPQININELRKLMAAGEKIHLIDVRSADEHEAMNIGGKLIPLSELSARKDEIPKDGKTVIYCASGQRSMTAIEILRSKFGYDNLYNLEGGIINTLQNS